MKLKLTLDLDRFRDDDGYLSEAAMLDSLRFVCSRVASAEARLHEPGAPRKGVVPVIDAPVEPELGAGVWTIE
jgi:hypothetical protein